jgi:hypothetical protein
VNGKAARPIPTTGNSGGKRTANKVTGLRGEPATIRLKLNFCY